MEKDELKEKKIENKTKDKIASFLEEFVLGKKEKTQTKDVIVNNNENSDINTDNKENSNTNENNEKKNITGKLQIEKMIKLFKAINSLSIMKSDDKPVEILDNIFIGSFAAAQNKDELKNNNITHILNAASIVKNFYPEEFVYLKLENLLDSPESDIKQYFHKCIDFIKDCISKGGKVLVHCHAGISRSSTLIISYMIKEKDFTFEDALVFCKNKRDKINPNTGFQKQLKEFEECIKSMKKSDIEITVGSNENDNNYKIMKDENNQQSENEIVKNDTENKINTDNTNNNTDNTNNTKDENKDSSEVEEELEIIL